VPHIESIGLEIELRIFIWVVERKDLGIYSIVFQLAAERGSLPDAAAGLTGIVIRHPSSVIRHPRRFPIPELNTGWARLVSTLSRQNNTSRSSTPRHHIRVDGWRMTDTHSLFA
jgi:hypothetical protein